MHNKFTFEIREWYLKFEEEPSGDIVCHEPTILGEGSKVNIWNLKISFRFSMSIYSEKIKK